MQAWSESVWNMDIGSVWPVLALMQESLTIPKNSCQSHSLSQLRMRTAECNAVKHRWPLSTNILHLRASTGNKLQQQTSTPWRQHSPRRAPHFFLMNCYLWINLVRRITCHTTLGFKEPSFRVIQINVFQIRVSESWSTHTKSSACRVHCRIYMNLSYSIHKYCTVWDSMQSSQWPSQPKLDPAHFVASKGEIFSPPRLMISL